LPRSLENRLGLRLLRWCQIQVTRQERAHPAMSVTAGG
jgi:hypothetical protein